MPIIESKRMNTRLRTENVSDYLETEEVIRQAFLGAEHTNGKEWLLVQRLRSSANFIKELSIIAIYEDEVIGHILFTPVDIVSSNGENFQSLALAPVSVLPKFQGQGIGGQLIELGHSIAKKLDFKSVIVLGHAEYYPRFGYQRASEWNIKAPFEIPDEVFMANELVPRGLTDVSGVVRYPAEFMDT